MLQTTLSMLETLLSSSHMTDDEISIFLQIYSHYKVGKWIYPGAMQRISKIPIIKIYSALNILEKERMVESYFEVICTECKHTTAMVYKSLDEIPSEYFCEECNHSGNAIDGAVLIYKVIRNE